MLSLSGFELAYPSKVDESVRVTLEGNTPTVAQTTNKTIIKVQEVDSHSNIVSTVDRTTMVINTGEKDAAISAKRADLQTFAAISMKKLLSELTHPLLRPSIMMQNPKSMPQQRSQQLSLQLPSST